MLNTLTIRIVYAVSSGCKMADKFSTSDWLRTQWSNPHDIFTILLIIGGDIVQKAIAQLTAGPVPRLTPVSFSFGWVHINSPVS